MATITAKRGDTLTISGTRTDAAGNAVSLAGVTVASEMKRNGTTQSLTATTIDAASGTFRLTLDAATTATLNPGLWHSDVEFTDVSGQVISTDTFTIELVTDITNAS